jgi:outer membrane protein TolC
MPDAQLPDPLALALELARARYQAGQDSYLGTLVNQRTLYVSQQGLIATRLAEQANWVTLYTVLGGDWKEPGP